MTRRLLLPAMLLLPLLAACSDGKGSADVGMGVNPAGSGHVAVRMTDAPLDMATVQSVWVTVDSVTVYPRATMDGSEPAPVALATHPGSFDLLTLTGGATDLLADGSLPAGFYDRIRMGVPEAHLVFKDGTEAPLKIESQKVDVPIGFELTVNEQLELVLDFNAAASVQVNDTATDKYILRPVVTAVAHP
jgi:uncharacterized protein DUF4382